MTTTPEDRFGPGGRVGPYEIVRELGRGGMGRVLLAHDGSTGGRLVALKVLLADTTHRPLLEARFQREIRNLAALRHRGIVTIFTAGTFAGHPYLVMDYLPGRDLREYLLEGAHLPAPQRLRRVLRVMIQVADAVQHAHEHGIVHRDIKPSNVRIAAGSDEAVLLDFGISKCLDDLGLTGVEMPGTALYMAPEQFEVALLDREHLIDVWALGVNLYLAITGELPFKGDSSLALAHAVLHGEPEPPSRVNPRLPPALDALVLACLAKVPRERVPSAGALARALEELVADGATDARSVASRTAEAAPTVVAANEPGTGLVPAPPTVVAPSARGGDRPAAARRRAVAAAAVVLLALAGGAAAWSGRATLLGLLDAARDRTLPAPLAARGGDRPATGVLGGDRPAAATAVLGAERLHSLLAADEQVARSVLVYTSDIDAPSRRHLMAAFKELADDRPQAALPRLQAFLRANPRGALVPLVRFWSGTAALATGRLADALHDYDAIVASAPRSEYAPRALLFAAAASAELGDAARAAALRDRLAADYPNSAAARDVVALRTAEPAR